MSIQTTIITRWDDLSVLASRRAVRSGRITVHQALTLTDPCELLLCGCCTPRELASALPGAEYHEEADAVIVHPRRWHADDGNAEVEYTCDSGSEAAQEYVDTGDWSTGSETIWIDVRTWRVGLDADGDTVCVDEDWHTIPLEPEEPDCEQGHDHDWRSPYSLLGGLRENPGVWGHGGGVVITECCAHCGTYRITDTWAQNPETGEQGLRSVNYRESDDDSLAWLWRVALSDAQEVTLPGGYSLRVDNEEAWCELVRDEDDASVRVRYDELREVAESESWDAIIDQLPDVEA